MTTLLPPAPPAPDASPGSIGSAPGPVENVPVVRAAAELAVELAGDAARLEREGVDRQLLERLAARGLLAVYGPAEHGGLAPAAQRRVAELLAGASNDAWFCWFQHGPVVKMLAASENTALAGVHVPALCSGAELGGVAWSHLRTASPSVHATRVAGGWSLTGSQPWCTGWGLVDVVLAGALVPSTDQVVFGLVPARPSPQLRSTGELGLAAMGGTSTHALQLSELVLADEDVVLVAERGPWAERDTAANANVQPSTFGIALAALDLLEDRAGALAAGLRAQVLDVRTAAYRLLDEVHPGERVEQRLALRAEALLLATRCCTALLTASGGKGMDLSAPAQRLLRGAAFQMVHSQAPHVRTATLDALAA